MTIEDKGTLADLATEEWWPLVRKRIRAGQPHPVSHSMPNYIRLDILRQYPEVDEADAKKAASLACVRLRERAKKYKEGLDGITV